MAQELRQRSTRAAKLPSEHSSAMSHNNNTRQAKGLTAPSMLKASPQQHGYVVKLHVPQLYSILPRFLQKLINSVWFLSALLGPSWERRYLILLGSFLYKFVDHASPGPKGAPVPIDSVEVNILAAAADDDDDSLALDCLLPGYTHAFVVSTLHKKYYYGVSSREEAMTWVNALREARQEAITRSMGHADRDSYPQSWSYFDSLGLSLRKSKDRIRDRMERSTISEMEMSNLADGGPIPRGYYG